MAGNPYDQFDEAPGGGFIQTGPADPTLPLKRPTAEADLRGKNLDNAGKERDVEIDAITLKVKQLELEKAVRDAEEKRARSGQTRDIAAEARRIVELARDLKQKSASEWFATGFGNVPMRYIPGTPAYDAAQNVQTIQGATALEKLADLRANSPTGGNPFGQMSNADMELLKNSVAALDTGQSDGQFQKNMDFIISSYSKLLPENEQVKEKDAQQPTIGGANPVAGGSGGGIPPGGGGLPPGSPPAAGGDPGVLTSEGKFMPDPVLKGVNARVSTMIRQGASAGAIREYLNSIQPGMGSKVERLDEAIRYQNLHPDRAPNIDLEKVWKPNGPVARTVGELGQTAPGQFFIRAGDALTGGMMDNATENPALSRAVMDAGKQASPTADFLGGLTGNVLGTAGVGKALGIFGKASKLASSPVAADALYGAIYGAGSADEGSRGLGALWGAGANAIGSKLGAKATSLAGSAIKGVTDPAVQYLAQRGVRMTPGQMAGGRLKSLEDRWTGAAGLGDTINDQRRRSLVDFNLEAGKQGYEPVGFVPTTMKEAGVQAGGSAVSDFYNQTLDPVSATADPAFMAGLQRIKMAGQQIPGELAGEVDNTLSTRVGPFIDPNTGAIPGRNYQAIRQGVQTDMADLSGKPRYDLYRDQARSTIDEIDDLFRRQSPGTAEDLGRANTAWGNHNILQDAVLAGKNTDGIFTPAQLGQAAVANAKKFGGKGLAASEDRPFFDLQRAGQNVLPSKVPDSGTAGRVREGSATGKAVGAVLDAIRSPLYSGDLEPLIRAGLLERPQAMITAGEALKKRARPLGMFGGGVALQLLGQ